ncbi:ribose transport system substrate-binding protein [Trueperella bonasi]|uniref:Ribose transport system substrate-binding protein n=1 Tax=Trueperella bonasi TaxID=312286 RepID=A0ABT9NGC9_9ACTO|nr:ABC transporter substrate-binding protein [Trueperella bonasi]MDP9806453.1 ribose transport system substrate-binding protein [Trueperella bonasi]
MIRRFERRRRAALATLIGALTFGLAGCAGLGERLTDSDDKLDIAVVAKGYASPFWAAVQSGAFAAGEDLGVNVTFNGPDTESDVVRQVDQINLAHVMAPDAFVFSALDSSASVIALEQFVESGIPVVAFDSGVPGSDIPISTVATNNRAAAAAAAAHMIELTGGEGEVAILAQSSTSVTGTDRRDGFVDHLAEHAPDLKVVDIQYNDSDQAKAEQQASAIIQAHPNLSGIFATDDDGAVAAAQTARRVGADVHVIGFDSGAVQVQLVREGHMAGAVTQNPYLMGYIAVETAVKAARGEEVEPVIDSGFYWYDAENLDDPDIQKAIYD